MIDPRRRGAWIAGMKEKVVSANELQFIGEDDAIAYLSGEDRPFTGKVEDFYENGQKWWKANWKGGKLDGFYTSWYENGNKEKEGHYKDDKLMFAEVWKPNGEKCPVTNLEDGNGVVVEYDDDETEGFRNTYLDGEPVVD